MTTKTIISDLLVQSEKTQELKKEANHYPSWQLTDRQICDLELLLNGGFSPLTGFMGKTDYKSVLKDMRLEDGSLWPMPITLDITEDFAGTIKNKEKITLRDQEGFALAVLTISDIWQPDLEEEASAVYGTTDITHPAVNYLLNIGNNVYKGVKINMLSLFFLLPILFLKVFLPTLLLKFLTILFSKKCFFLKSVFCLRKN